MKNRLIILALGLSPPGTMGGNSKITVEMARCLAGRREVHFILPENKLATLTDNVSADHGIHIHVLPAFTGEDKLNPITAIRWFTPRLRTVLREISASPDDFLYCCSDFHVDVLPPYVLQKEFGFRWLPSVFLFVPFVFENLSRGYKFPAIKYIIYWFYQQTLFALMKRRATGFVVTNRSDFARFPKRFTGKLFDYYGGVNIEQIPPLQSNNQTIKQSLGCFLQPPPSSERHRRLPRHLETGFGKVPNRETVRYREWRSGVRTLLEGESQQARHCGHH